MKYHINAKGEPGLCKAKKSCPLGSDDEHYLSENDARRAYELKQELDNIQTLAGATREVVEARKAFRLEIINAYPVPKEKKAITPSFTSLLATSILERQRELFEEIGPIAAARPAEFEDTLEEPAMAMADLKAARQGNGTYDSQEKANMLIDQYNDAVLRSTLASAAYIENQEKAGVVFKKDDITAESLIKARQAHLVGINTLHAARQDLEGKKQLAEALETNIYSINFLLDDVENVFVENDLKEYSIEDIAKKSKTYGRHSTLSEGPHDLVQAILKWTKRYEG